MRVLLDTTYARRAPFSGTAIYLERLQDALARLRDVEVVPRANVRRRQPGGGGAASARNLLADQWWTGVELPRLAKKAGADLIHHPLPAFAPRTEIPQVITVHDLAFERVPKQFDLRFRLYARLAHRAAGSRADALVCVSETTARDVRERWKVASEKIVIARHGPGQPLPRTAGRRLTHFLYLGDAEPRKNLGTLLDAYRRYREQVPAPLELVLAGSAGADAPGVRVEWQPDAGRLAELLASAAALVHPSLYEGFGLTVLEAMRAGVPVIAGDCVEELCGDAARYVEVTDAEALAGAMAEIVAKPALRAELWQRGRRRASQFSWEASARAHRAAYSLALGR
jgi:glycosyltransferase involved in cell wall biosynthesis